jgi:hypothetical protein
MEHLRPFGLGVSFHSASLIPSEGGKGQGLIGRRFSMKAKWVFTSGQVG